MKSFLKSIVSVFLAVLARAVVRKYKPHIVMITGSVGKTSTKDAVAAALTIQFFVRKSERSYNSEFGVPFTILGVKNPWGNPFSWMRVIKCAFALIILPNHYPNLLVLEVGADRPGDIAKLLKIATPDIVVVTCLPKIPVHVEAYESPEAVREEEFSPAYSLPAAAPLILPVDDPYASTMALRTPARIISYGTEVGANIRITNIGFHEEEGKIVGMHAEVSSADTKSELVVNGSVGEVQIFPAVAAIAVASVFDLSLKETLKALRKYEPPAGRGRLFAGIHDSIIIDDSYNSSPTAVEEALNTLKTFPRAKRRIVILGDMLELGRYSVTEHERIGALAANTADIIIAVGIRAHAFVAAALASGMQKDMIQNYDDAQSAEVALKAFLQEGDVVLVKGSQSIRTEQIVEGLLADRSERLRLVRQENEWLRRR